MGSVAAPSTASGMATPRPDHRRTDGSVTLLGRCDQVINTGSEKVFAEDVEQVIATHLDIAGVTAQVRGAGDASKPWREAKPLAA